MLIQILSTQNLSKGPSRRLFNKRPLNQDLSLKKKRKSPGRRRESRRKSLRERRESLTNNLKSTENRRRYKRDSPTSRQSIQLLSIRVFGKSSEVIRYKTQTKISVLFSSKTKTCKTLFWPLKTASESSLEQRLLLISTFKAACFQHLTKSIFRMLLMIWKTSSSRSTQKLITTIERGSVMSVRILIF